MKIKINKSNLSKINNKKYILATVLSSMSLGLSGCSNNGYDTNYGFNEALIYGDDTATLLNVASWSDYDGEQLQFITDDNMVVLSSSFDTIAFSGNNSEVTPEAVAQNGISENGEVNNLLKDSQASFYNKELFDTKWSFNRALVFNGNNALVLNVKKWKDYPGEQLKVETEEGLILNLCSYNSKLVYDVNSDTKAQDLAAYYVGSDGTVSDYSNDASYLYNYEVVDFNNAFDKAIIIHNGKSIILPIDSWNDYEGEQLQIKIPDGPLLLTDSYHTILLNDQFSTLKAQDIAASLSETGEIIDYSQDKDYAAKYFNQGFIDYNNGFNTGILSDGYYASTINIKKWLDYEGEQLQITLDSGDTLLTSSMMLNMLNGGSNTVNASTLAEYYSSSSVNDNTNFSQESSFYNRTIFDTATKFNYALKVVDGNVTIIPLKYWKDFENDSNEKGSPFRVSPYSYKPPKTSFSDENDDEDKKEEEKQPNCEQLELTLPDGTTIVTTAYDTVLVNSKSDINEIAELFKGSNGVISDLTEYVGAPTNSLFNYNYFERNCFTHAIMNNGTNNQVIPIKKWIDYPDGEQLQLKIDASSAILTSYVNTTLVYPKTEGITEVIASAFEGSLKNKDAVKVYELK